ncbi:flavodoxin [Mariniluteicoccus flavus]
MSVPPRAVTRRTLLGGVGAVAAAGLAACTSPSLTGGPAATPNRGGANRVLLAFFSRPGENYWNGGRRTLEVGNTQVLAELIGERIACDVYRIEAAEPYPERYDPTVRRNLEEQESDARPTMAKAAPDMRGYETVLLGSPIWNVQPPMIMATFVEAIEAAGKDLVPFVTYAVSGPGQTEAFYGGLDTGALVRSCLAIRGEEVREPGPGPGADVDRWLLAAGLV